MITGLFTKTRARPEQTPGHRGNFNPAQRAKLPDNRLRRAFQQGRFGALVRDRAQWEDDPQFQSVFEAAVRAIDEQFALVPEGLVSIAVTIFDQPGQPERDYETAPYLLARKCTSNADFQRFVDDGGYQQLELWPEDIWPHLVGFKDQTGQPGPRYWMDGRHDRRLADHPVVGICYYEAAAYAAWAGFHLPEETSWQMAASWRIRSAANMQRRYPWGDTLDLERCNVWASGRAEIVPVDALPLGAAPNGVLQLIGNVWEWTNSDFESVDRDGRRIVGGSLMKSIRGGAYDTYFPWQATSTFRTGLEALARTHNVGFRCAMEMLSE